MEEIKIQPPSEYKRFNAELDLQSYHEEDNVS